MEENVKENLEEGKGSIRAVSGLYEDWFLDYASYVILERAVPMIEDGLKPVQRRILHAMKVMDDGRFNKVANIIGQTMQYHPHGDAAIGDALVNMGQKDLLIETQGNWGDYRTGDSAAAPRYIEARLSKFALAVAFNKDITEWQLSYDGRNKEPVSLPMKFPLSLAQGVEGIAVGLSTRILPHNFQELCKASIDILKGKKTQLIPDFPTGGVIDPTEYKSGERGGKVRVRARIEALDKKTLVIRDVPYGVTTTALIDSIIKANDKGKIKIKKVVDNTAAEVEVVVELAPGVSPEVTLDALYAFTNCEVSISPNACIIIADKPHFLTVDEILRISTGNTRELLKRELEIRLSDLEDKWHFASLEKIFIENRIYRDIEECETWEAVIQAIDSGLDPFKPMLNREVTEEDIVRLTEIKIKRISKYDSFKADDNIKKLEAEMDEIRHHLKHLTEYAIAYFEELITKFGKGRERKTEIRPFETITARAVAANNVKLYVNMTEGFIGYGLKKDEFVADCSDLDDIIVIRKDGKMSVTRITDKTFVGKGILHVGVWKKGDDRMVYNLIYTDLKSKKNYAKRFNVISITRDKEYDLGKNGDSTRVIYLTANPNGESEVVSVQLHPSCTARKKLFEFDFGELGVKGRRSQGNILSKYPIRKVMQKEVGSSTLGGREIWYDDTVGRLNTDERGRLLGDFDTGDLILVIYNNGEFELTDFELTNRYQMDKIVQIEKFDPEKVYSVIHLDGKSKLSYVKRFVFEAGVPGRKYSLISDTPGSKMLYISADPSPVIRFHYKKGKTAVKTEETVDLAEFIDVKGWKANGNRLCSGPLTGKLIELKGEAGNPDVKSNEKSTKENKNEESGEHPPEKKPSPKSNEKKGKGGDENGSFNIGAQIEWDF